MKPTIYPLTGQEEEILVALERDQIACDVILNMGEEQTKSLVRRELIWYNRDQALFMITHLGVAQLKARGKSTRGKPAWKENIYEMTAGEAILLFTDPKVLVNEKKLKLTKPKPIRIKRENKIHP